MRTFIVISLSLILCAGCNETSAPADRNAQIYDVGGPAVDPDSEGRRTAPDGQSVDDDVSDIGALDAVVVSATDFGEVDLGAPQPIDSAISDSEVVPEVDSMMVLPMRGTRGQCALDEDCGSEGDGNVSCSRVFPGGACMGCGGDIDCPGSTECSSFGTCVTTCEAEGDCPPGTMCLGSGRCAQQRGTQGACPDPRYDCNDSSRCERRACSDGTDCDASMFCLDNLCVSDAWQ